MCDASNVQSVTLEAAVAALYVLVAKLETVGPFGLGAALRLCVDAYAWGSKLTRPASIEKMRRLGVQKGWGPVMDEATVALIGQAADLAAQGLSIAPVLEVVPWGREGTGEVDLVGRAAFFRRLKAVPDHVWAEASELRCYEQSRRGAR